MKHLPTGIMIRSTQERSQLRNREVAWETLRAKLYQIEEDKQKAEADRTYSEKGEIGWGEPDPLIRLPALPDGQRPPHRRRNWQHPKRHGRSDRSFH